VERLPGATLIEARPITGRTHQIRVHAQHAGFPLLGDDKYSDERTAAFCQQIGLKRLFLHAHSLRFSLPDVGRLELQAELGKRGIELPIIFITGHGDVRMSVKAVRAGAINFLEKPFSNEDLLASIKEAFSHADASRKYRSQVAALRKRHASLTSREREVIQHVVAGMSNRALGDLLGVCDRTIEVHRARVMKKMGAESLPDLVRKYAMFQKGSL